MPEMNGHEFVKQVKMDNQKQELIRHHGKALEIKRVDNSYILVIQNGSTELIKHKSDAAISISTNIPTKARSFN